MNWKVKHRHGNNNGNNNGNNKKPQSSVIDHAQDQDEFTLERRPQRRPSKHHFIRESIEEFDID
jgi:hypothetical protein